MRTYVLSAIGLATALLSAPVTAVAGPVITAASVTAARTPSNTLEKVYYYHGQYYPYRYHGAYYRHRHYRYGRWHYY